MVMLVPSGPPHIVILKVFVCFLHWENNTIMMHVLFGGEFLVLNRSTGSNAV